MKTVQLKRVYPNDTMHTSDSQQLIGFVTALRLHPDKESETYKKVYKHVHNGIRKWLGTDRLIGTAPEDDEDGNIILVGMFIYDIVATDDAFYPQIFDEERGLPYIEVEVTE